MTNYRLGERLTPFEKEEPSLPNLPVAVCLSDAEWDEAVKEGALPPLPETRHDQIRFTRAEPRALGLVAAFCVPRHHYAPGEERRFALLASKNGMFFRDEGGSAQALLKNISEAQELQRPTYGYLLYCFLETLIASDLIYLDELEHRITKLEDSVMNGTLEQFNNKMIALRKELLGLSGYYRQLADLGVELQENDNALFCKEELRLLNLFTARVNSLYGQVQSLREYSLQVREAYQTQIDLHQNVIMKILTVVTAIFLPLTLIVGWYGMNFANMPELHWRFGYPLVILASLLLVAGSVFYFKKKKYF